MRYFHCLVSHKRKCNYVEEIVIYNSTIRGNDSMRKKTQEYFQSMYAEDRATRPKLDGFEFKTLEASSRISMEREFSEDETWDGLNYCNWDKAPDPDGFNTTFLQEFRVVIKKDIIEMLKSSTSLNFLSNL